METQPNEVTSRTRETVAQMQPIMVGHRYKFSLTEDKNYNKIQTG